MVNPPINNRKNQKPFLTTKLKFKCLTEEKNPKQEKKEE